MPVPAQTSYDTQNVQAIYDGLIQELATFQALRVAGLPLPSYGKDGQSVQWESWRTAQIKAIADVKEILQYVSGPTIYLTRARG